MAIVNIDFTKTGMDLVIGRNHWFIVTEQKNLTDKFLDTVTEKLGCEPSEGNRKALRYYLLKNCVLEQKTLIRERCKELGEKEVYYHIYGKNFSGGYDIEEVTIIEL